MQFRLKSFNNTTYLKELGSWALFPVRRIGSLCRGSTAKAGVVFFDPNNNELTKYKVYYNSFKITWGNPQKWHQNEHTCPSKGTIQHLPQ